MCRIFDSVQNGPSEKIPKTTRQNCIGLALSVHRCFFPIGHGAFLLERLIPSREDPINIVFDCGSKNKALIASQISNFNHGPIDYLVLSHFHIDHINGAVDLIKKCGVKKTIIPSISKMEALLYCVINHFGINISRAFLRDPRSIIGIDFDNVIEVPPSILGEANSNAIGSTTQILYQSKSPPRFFQWILKCHVAKFQDFLPNNEDKIQLKEISEKTNLTSGDLDDAKVIYRTIKQKFHMTNLITYSGPSPLFTGNLNCPLGILVNGDSEQYASENGISEIITHFQQERGCISAFVMPHHGRRTSYIRDRPLTEFPQLQKILIQDASSKKKYRVNFNLPGIIPIEITENCDKYEYWNLDLNRVIL